VKPFKDGRMGVVERDVERVGGKMGKVAFGELLQCRDHGQSIAQRAFRECICLKLKPAAKPAMQHIDEEREWAPDDAKQHQPHGEVASLHSEG
jgi:hypothetical protein